MAMEKATPPAGSMCQQPVKGADFEQYVDCGKPAGWIVRHAGPKKERAGYRMCLDCATQTIKDGGNYVLKGERYIPVTDNRPPVEDVMEGVEEAPEEDAAAKTDKHKLVGQLARQQVLIQREIADLEAKLKDANDRLAKNSESDLPEAMRDAELKYFETIQGGTVELKTNNFASIPKKHHAAGMKFIYKHAPSLPKHVVEIEFGREDQSFFKKFLADLAKRKRKVKAVISASVHPSTLRKWVREIDEHNAEFPNKAITLPNDILGIFRKKIALVKMPDAAVPGE